MDFTNTRNTLDQFVKANSRPETEEELLRRKVREANASFKAPAEPLVLAPQQSEQLADSTAPVEPVAPQPSSPGKTLSESIKSNAPGAGDDILSKKEKKSIFDQMREKAKEARENRSSPSYDGDSLKKALDEAKKLYKEESSRNEWLELAQVLARAGVQFAAAATGGDRANMSNLNFGPGIDYTGRTERARKDYQQEAENIEKQSNLQRQKEQDENRLNEKDTDRDLDIDKLELDSIENEKNRANQRHLAGIKDKGSDADDWRARQLEFQQWKEDVDNADKDYTRSNSLAENRVALAALVSQMDDASPKALAKLEEKSPGIFQKAGVTPAQIEAITKDATKKGILWDSMDPAKRNELIQQKLVEPVQAQTSNLKQILDDLKQRRRSSVPAPTQQAPARDPKIEQYAQQNKLPYEKAEAILKSRGYQPAH